MRLLDAPRARKSPRETVQEKAGRLVDNYRVILTSATGGLVIGDHSTYQVDVAGSGSCQCKWMRFRGWQKPCSHILAARRALRDPASQEAVRPLAQLRLAAQALAGEDNAFAFR